MKTLGLFPSSLAVAALLASTDARVRRDEATQKQVAARNPKPSKAEKKAAKRERTAERVAARAP